MTMFVNHSMLRQSGLILQDEIAIHAGWGRMMRFWEGVEYQ